MGVWSTPATWAAGIPTVANFNARIRDQFDALGDAWTAYTPTWTAVTTNPVIGNGTITGRYRQIGKTIDYDIVITMGSTTTYGTGTYLFSLPVASRTLATYHPMGMAGLFDFSLSAPFMRSAGYSNTTNVFLISEAGAAVTPTVPFTFATSDYIRIHGTYEAA